MALSDCAVNVHRTCMYVCSHAGAFLDGRKDSAPNRSDTLFGVVQPYTLTHMTSVLMHAMHPCIRVCRTSLGIMHAPKQLHLPAPHRLRCVPWAPVLVPTCLHLASFTQPDFRLHYSLRVMHPQRAALVQGLAQDQVPVCSNATTLLTNCCHLVDAPKHHSFFAMHNHNNHNFVCVHTG